tara:strand:- start:271 stop:660 length:390 start_codon:yes stop_codon:yes gene_type:complete
MTQRINISLPKDMAKFLAEECKRNSNFVGVLGTKPEPYECYDEFVDQYEQQKDSQTLEIFQLGLSQVEHSQLEDLLAHVKHSEMEARPEEKLRFINLSTINGILEKLKILGFQEGAKSDDFFFNNNNPY